MLVVAYDVSDNRRRRRLHERLLDHGIAVQYSVFEIPESAYDDVLRVLHRETREADAVRIYRLCRNCLQRVEVMGSRAVRLRAEKAPAVIEIAHDPSIAPPRTAPQAQPAQTRVRKSQPGALERGLLKAQSRLLALVCAMENLDKAFLDVRANRGCAGADGVTIAAFDRRRADGLQKLQTQLLNGSYRPEPLRQVLIPKADGSSRILRIPAVRDRIAQQAVLRVLAPLWEREFERCSFAYRRGRSVRGAVALLARHRDAGLRWVLEADIEHFFDEVDHEIVVERFRELVMDEAVVRLVRAWITAPTEGIDAQPSPVRGLPQGASVSPLLSNVFLDEFDEQMLALGYHLVRYADDFVVACASRDEAEDAFKDAERILATSKLRLKREKTRITSFEQGFRFLGYVFNGDVVQRAPRRSHTSLT